MINNEMYLNTGMSIRSLSLILLSYLFCFDVIATPIDSKIKAQIHKGLVLEVLDAGTYTYVKVKGSKETLWAATTKINLTQGVKVEFSKSLPMINFKSKTLNRTFKKVYFVNDISGLKNKTIKSKKKLGANKRAVYKREIKLGSIKKSDYTVFQVWDKKESLKGKEISIRAKVVKVTPKVMNKNWVHLQDGSGDKKNYDLIVTTQQLPKVGEVILFKAKVALNKDFGFGYFYKLLLENGTIIK